MDTEYKIRFLNRCHDGNFALPRTWGHPRLEETFEGAQVLGLCEGLDIAESGQHYDDDWFSSTGYSHVMIVEVTDCSGESGPLKYNAVTEDDVEAIHVIEYTDSAFGWAMEELANKYEDEGYEIARDVMGFAADGWWDEVGAEKIVARLAEKATTVEPKFVDGP